MSLGPQFEQPELPLTNQSKPTKPESSFDYKKRQVASGVGTTRSAHDQRINTFAESPMENRTPTDSFHRRGDQLKMFMTPREIEREWQPLDADRDEVEAPVSYGTDDTRAGSRTNRPERTDGVPNVYQGYRQTNSTGGHEVLRPQFKRPSSNSPSYDSGTETDEQLWDRKYEEATEYGVHGQHSYGQPLEYVNSQGKTTQHSAKHVVRLGDTRKGIGRSSDDLGGTGLYRNTEGEPTYNSRRRSSSWHQNEAKEDSYESMADSVAREGVKSPIRLGLNYGENDKPQMAGGHHRMAVARVHSPDQFAPVLYHKDIHEARSANTKGAYPYT